MIGKSSTMTDRVNKTSICSILFLDIIDYSKKSDSDQIDVKNQFNDLISRSLKSVAQTDRIILDTGDGVAIALMGSPEDAMFVGLTIRDGILKNNTNNPVPLFVRFGINLGPVRIVTDINGQPNIIGDGINVAQRIMSFAKPNQILVSRTYYEVTSRVTLEFSEMFDYSGVKHDKHVREHEVYSVRPHKDQVSSISPPAVAKDNFQLPKPLAIAKKVNWKYAAPGMLAVVALLGFAKLMPLESQTATPKVTFKPNEADINNPVVINAALNFSQANKPVNVSLMTSEKIDSLPITETKYTETSLPEAKVIDATEASKLSAIEEDKLAQEKLEKSKIIAKKTKKKLDKQKADQKKQEEISSENVAMRMEPAKNISSEAKLLEHKRTADAVVAVKASNKEKSGLEVFADSFKQGQKNECTQAQISMNQCR